MELPKDLKDKIWDYCRLNEITDLNGFIIKTLKKGFDTEVYGLLGKTLNDGEKHLKTGIVGEKQVEIEVIREIRVEIPVEVIKEVIVEKEIIKEVPVEVIKEIEKVVTKIEYISDKTSENELGGKIANLEENIFQLNKDLDSERKIFSTKTEEMEIFFQNEMSKKDKELEELRQSLDVKLDNTNEKMLQETLQKLRKEITEKNKKIEELEKINKGSNNGAINAIFMKGSNLKDIL
jgi:predicted RNase H-like nuclease (RuvC/YqgF family)